MESEGGTWRLCEEGRRGEEQVGTVKRALAWEPGDPAARPSPALILGMVLGMSISLSGVSSSV